MRICSSFVIRGFLLRPASRIKDQPDLCPARIEDRIPADRPFLRGPVRGKRRDRVVVGMIVAFRIDEARRKQQRKDRDRNHDPKEPFLLLCAVFFMRPPE